MREKLQSHWQSINRQLCFLGLLLLVSLVVMGCQLPPQLASDAQYKEIFDIVWLPAKKVLVAGGMAGIYSSRDGGQSWVYTPTRVMELRVYQNRIWGWYSYEPPHGPTRVLPYLVYSDDGFHWQVVPVPFDGKDPLLFALLPTTPEQAPLLLTTPGLVWQLDPAAEPTLWSSWSVRNNLSVRCNRYDCRTGMMAENALYLSYKRLGTKREFGIYFVDQGREEMFSVDGGLYIQRFWLEGEQCWAQALSGDVYTVRCGQNHWQFVERRPLETADEQFPDLVQQVNDELFQVYTTYTDQTGQRWVGTTHGLFREDKQGWIHILPNN